MILTAVAADRARAARRLTPLLPYHLTFSHPTGRPAGGRGSGVGEGLCPIRSGEASTAAAAAGPTGGSALAVPDAAAPRLRLAMSCCRWATAHSAPAAAFSFSAASISCSASAFNRPACEWLRRTARWTSSSHREASWRAPRPVQAGGGGVARRLARFLAGAAPGRPCLRRHAHAARLAWISPCPTSASAICTALRAAPLRRLSDTHQKARPLGTVGSRRRRET